MNENLDEGVGCVRGRFGFFFILLGVSCYEFVSLYWLFILLFIFMVSNVYNLGFR